MNVKNFIIKMFVDAVAVIICAYLLPGVTIAGFGIALLVALSLALLNRFVKPLLVLLTIPATILTLGLFLLVVNALIILLADWIVLGFEVGNFWWALIFSFALTFIQSLLNGLLGKSERSDKVKRNDY